MRSWSVSLAVVAAALAAPRVACGEQLPLASYTTSDGLASDRVQCILSDSHGFLWIGTEDGISRFDGLRFSNLAVTDLPGGDVRAILESRDGTYWAATDRGLAHWNPSLPQTKQAPRVAALHIAVGTPSDSVRALVEDRSGALWAGTADGLFRVEPRGKDWRIERMQLPFAERSGGVRINGLKDDPGGAPWVAAEAGPDRRVSEASFERIGGRDRPPAGVRSLLLARDGSLWAGQYEGLLELKSDERGGLATARRFDRISGLAGDHVAALVETSDGKIW